MVWVCTTFARLLHSLFNIEEEVEATPPKIGSQSLYRWAYGYVMTPVSNYLAGAFFPTFAIDRSI